MIGNKRKATDTPTSSIKSSVYMQYGYRVSTQINYQFRRSCRLTDSYAVFDSVRDASSSERYWSMAWSILYTGNSAREAADCGRFISSSQSDNNTAMSDDTACTFFWSLKGGIWTRFC